jgi:hypothetical protein
MPSETGDVCGNVLSLYSWLMSLSCYQVSYSLIGTEKILLEFEIRINNLESKDHFMWQVMENHLLLRKFHITLCVIVNLSSFWTSYSRNYRRISFPLRDSCVGQRETRRPKVNRCPQRNVAEEIRAGWPCVACWIIKYLLGNSTCGECEGLALPFEHPSVGSQTSDPIHKLQASEHLHFNHSLTLRILRAESE